MIGNNIYSGSAHPIKCGSARYGGWISVAGHPNPTPIRNIHGQIVRANMENGGGKNIEAKAYTYT